MWEGFIPHSNPLLPILEAAVPTSWKAVTDPRREVDLEIGSVYPSKIEIFSSLVKGTVLRGRPNNPVDVREAYSPPGKSANAQIGIWYTPENRRPPNSGWDAYLSFDPDSWPHNAYLPFWQLNSDLFGGRGRGLLGESLEIDTMTEARDARPSKRDKFCCAIIRNPDPVRLRAISALEQVGRVDVFGPYARRPVPSKAEVLRKYRFALVFENDLYPGYVTEKVFDAWQCETLPLYWGLDSHGYLNKKAILNLADMTGPDEWLQRVTELESDPTLLDEMASRPILLSRPSPHSVLDLIRATLEIGAASPS